MAGAQAGKSGSGKGGHHEEEILGKAYDSRLMRRLLRYLLPYRTTVLIASGAMIFHSLLQVVGPFLTKVAVDRYLVATERQPTFLDPFLSADPWTGLAQITGLYLLALAALFALEYAQTYTMQMVGQRAMYDLRMELFGHLHRLPVQFYDRNPVGRLLTRVTSDVDVLNEMFTSGVVAVFGDFFSLLFILVVMLQLSAPLALVTFAVLPLIALATSLFRRRVRDCYRRIRTAIARINAHLQEHVTGMSVVQLFNREQKSFAEFDEINRAHQRAFLDSIFAHSLFYPTIEVLSSVAIASILWYGGLRVAEGTLTIGIVVAFIQYAQRFFRPIQDLSEKYNILQGAMASSERIFKLLDTPVAIESPADAVVPAPETSQGGRIEFRDVWFAYNDDDWVLQDISLTIEPGETVAVVGHTGAGKTTLTSLPLRFYDVQQGQVLVDGVDVRRWDLTALRKRFGVVLQDPFLFAGTIESNIRLGTEHISQEDVEEAIEELRVGDFIRSLPGGYQEEVRERGTTLSVGQKQLISFARALAHNPQILILDEATSSVDTETEFRVREALGRMVGGRTSIIIAHRLSTIQRADRIVVLHKGRVREVGSHQELLAQRGIYWKLYQLQYKDQEVGVGGND
ncbi:MAG: antibiotic ABC transporter ATP-binding protein [Acidobacteria bacterium RIFCSPLOWO2_02_FULL_61_28]|nr:MAG: antibiotic ABC transporter ATP-binding protein [Acidobacteria bacterium RIFCSPLOWO2_02_FULL_61_28]